MNREKRAELARRLVGRFRQLRDDEGWTQESLAEVSGVPLRTVSDTLREVSVPNGGTLEKLAEALGVALSEAEERETWPEDIQLHHDTTGLILAPWPTPVRVAMMQASIRAMMETLEALRPGAAEPPNGQST